MARLKVIIKKKICFQCLTKESIRSHAPVRSFFTTLASRHLDLASGLARLDFLACSVALHRDSSAIGAELSSLVGVSAISLDFVAERIKQSFS